MNGRRVWGEAKGGPVQSGLAEAGVRELSGYVGFANIPNQVYRAAMRRGFEVTLMAVGASGLGKSTFLNSLFSADVRPEEEEEGRVVPKAPPQTTAVRETELQLTENGVALRLTLVDTPGFGDQLDNSRAAEPILAYVEGKFRAFFEAETRVERKEVEDGRVHVCLYFLQPTGHGLKPLDVEVMRQLSSRLNLVPLIAKADTLTADELAAAKDRVRQELRLHKIKLYDFPVAEQGTEEVKEPPFAVVGSNALVDVAGRKVRGRRYPWGVVEVENGEHNDFTAFRDLLVRNHLADLLDTTRNVHYENFRCRVLMSGTSGPAKAPDSDPFTFMEDQQRQHAKHLEAEEKRREQVLTQKVKAKVAELEVLQKQLAAKQECKSNDLRIQLQLNDTKRHAIAAIRKEHPGLKPYHSASSLGSGLTVPSAGTPGRRSWSGSHSKLDDSHASKRSWITNKIHGKK